MYNIKHIDPPRNLYRQQNPLNDICIHKHRQYPLDHTLDSTEVHQNPTNGINTLRIKPNSIERPHSLPNETYQRLLIDIKNH